MPDTILVVGSGATVTPLLVLSVTSAEASTSTVHRIIGRRDPDITLGPLDTATGSIVLLHADADSAAQCAALHRSAGVFILTCESQPAWSRRYVVEGAVTTAIDAETLRRWTVTIGYREVPA